MKELILTKGFVSLVDDEDFERLNQWKWSYGPGYGLRKEPHPDGHMFRKTIYLHKVIIDCPEGKQIDHINCNRLDNRKCNLRIVDSKDNAKNKGIAANNTTGYKGVNWCKRTKKYAVKIGIDHVRKFVGYFTDIEEAAEAYNRAALKYHGEFAKLNTIKEGVK